MRVGTQSLSQQFSLSTRKYTTQKIQEFTNIVWGIVSDTSDGWEGELKKALGIQIPKDMVGRKTQPQGRPFPYMRSGELQGSVQARFSRRKGREGTYTFSVTGEIGTTPLGSFHAKLTNAGANSDKSAGWIGWKDDVLFGDGRGNVPSLRSIFENVKKYRKDF